jgi:hypothetical protein
LDKRKANAAALGSKGGFFDQADLRLLGNDEILPPLVQALQSDRDKEQASR